MKVCILGDQQHCGEAKANNVESMNAEPLKKVNKNKKKLVKKLAKSYDASLASEPAHQADSPSARPRGSQVHYQVPDEEGPVPVCRRRP
ncbi:hypothetical protein KR067_003446 [Drosophila pandora]|nr:hypothetical protein KR067_003446 [Drosophila pandora]